MRAQRAAASSTKHAALPIILSFVILAFSVTYRGYLGFGNLRGLSGVWGYLGFGDLRGLSRPIWGFGAGYLGLFFPLPGFFWGIMMI